MHPVIGFLNSIKMRVNLKKTNLLLSIMIIGLISACDLFPRSADPISEQATDVMMDVVSLTPTETLIATETKVMTVPEDVSTLFPEGMMVSGNKIYFPDAGLSMVLSLDDWEFIPEFYSKTSDFELFTFFRREKFFNAQGIGYSPTISVAFYTLPEPMDLIDFSILLRANFGSGFPTVERMFGFESREPVLNIPAFGFYGHSTKVSDYSIYTVHAINNVTGIAISFEIVDSVLDQAEPEFFEFIKSVNLEEISLDVMKEILSTNGVPYESMISAAFVSDALIFGGLDLSAGGDGKGSGVDEEGRIFNCSDLASHLVDFQNFVSFTVNDIQEIDFNHITAGDVVIFSDSTFEQIGSHAAIVTKIENDMVYVSGMYGPSSDGISYAAKYENLPITEFLPEIFQTMEIFHYVGN